MREFYENDAMDSAPEFEAALAPIDCSIFAPEVVGERYKKRLKELWSKRNVTHCIF